MNGIPEDFVINIDETGACYSITGGYTMEKCGSKQVNTGSKTLIERSFF